MENSTKEVLDAYFKSRVQSIDERARRAIDRPEVYEYESKLGKQIFEMNATELFEMLLTFKSHNGRVAKNRISATTAYSTTRLFKMVFQFYSDNYKLIRNPFLDDTFKGSNFTKAFNDSGEKYSKADLDALIEKIHNEYLEKRAIWLECMLLMFYNGIATMGELIQIKTSDLSVEEQTVSVGNRIVRLSDRCFETLITVNKMEEMDTEHGRRLMTSWRDSVFKFPCFPKKVGMYDNSPISEITGKLNIHLSEMVRKKFNAEVNASKLFTLGFYDFLCEKYGKEHIDEVITSKWDRMIEQEAQEYGFATTGMTFLKAKLLPFVQ